jgi:hypothetical protein
MSLFPPEAFLLGAIYRSKALRNGKSDEQAVSDGPVLGVPQETIPPSFVLSLTLGAEEVEE